MIVLKNLALKSFTFFVVALATITAHALDTPNHPVKFRVVAIAESGNTPHNEFVAAAKVWLQELADENDFAIDYITNTDPINDAFLAKYKLFIQLNYPPYRWTDVAKLAFQRYITRGTGGWVGSTCSTCITLLYRSRRKTAGLSSPGDADLPLSQSRPRTAQCSWCSGYLP